MVKGSREGRSLTYMAIRSSEGYLYLRYHEVSVLDNIVLAQNELGGVVKARRRMLICLMGSREGYAEYMLNGENAV